jgi:hypothetical protein
MNSHPVTSTKTTEPVIWSIATPPSFYHERNVLDLQVTAAVAASRPA